jgi:hypothetical protein
MPKTKITPIRNKPVKLTDAKMAELRGLLDQNTPKTQIAKRLGISRPTLDKWIGKLETVAGSEIIIKHSTDMVKKDLDMWTYVHGLAVKAYDLVENVERNIDWEDAKKRPDARDVQAYVKTLAEARKQAAQIADIQERIFNSERVKRVMEAYFEVLAKVDSNAYETLMTELERRGLTPRR